MTALLVLAVAADREIGLVRQSREQIDQPRRVRRLHLRTVFPLERLPRLLVGGTLPFRDKRLARLQLRQPRIVEDPRRELGLRHTARRPPNGADTQALAGSPWRTQPDNPDRHGSPPAVQPTADGSYPLLPTSRRQPS